MQNWENHYNLCKKAEQKKERALLNELLTKAQHNISKNEKSDWDWFIEALMDTEKKYFAAAVLNGCSIPKLLLPFMLQAAITETNPSRNKDFLIPCIATYGKEKISAILAEISKNGTETEKQGVERLSYWLQN